MAGPLGQRFKLKLKGLKECLRTWNKEVFWDIGSKKACLENILRWDRLEGKVGLDSSEMAACRKAQRDLKKTLEMEETMWRQKSKVK